LVWLNSPIGAPTKMTPGSFLRGRSAINAGSHRSRNPEETHLRGTLAAADDTTAVSQATFFYPDFTVGPGVSPDPAHSRSRALPPIGNWAV